MRANHPRNDAPAARRTAIQAAAEQVGESINGYVNKAVQARMGLEEWPEGDDIK